PPQRHLRPSRMPAPDRANHRQTGTRSALTIPIRGDRTRETASEKQWRWRSAGKIAPMSIARWVALAMVLLSAARALAQGQGGDDTDPGPVASESDADARARALFRTGDRAYAEGKYE